MTAPASPNGAAPRGLPAGSSPLGLGAAAAVLVGGGLGVAGAVLHLPALPILACIGHGLTAGALAVASSYWFAARSARLSLEAGGAGRGCPWANAARAAAPPEALVLEKLRNRVERRWRLLFVLGWAILPLGLFASLGLLPPPNETPRSHSDIFLPLWIAAVEALAVVLAAFFLLDQWSELLEVWEHLEAATVTPEPELPEKRSPPPTVELPAAAETLVQKPLDLDIFGDEEPAQPPPDPKPVTVESAPPAEADIPKEPSTPVRKKYVW